MVYFPDFKKVTPAALPNIARSIQPARIKSWQIVEVSHNTKQLFQDSFEALAMYNPPYIKNAPDAIAREMGYTDHSALQAQSKRNSLFLANMAVNEPKIARTLFDGMHNDPCFMENPDDHDIKPFGFTEILTAMKLTFPDTLSGKRGLQIGCGYGPFIHFMKEKHDMHMKGIDLNAAACRYAKNNGLDIENGNASKLPYPDNSFDLAISRHFLEEAYLNLFMGSMEKQLKEGDSSHLIARILMEIHRTLKPGGVFISFFERGIDEGTLHWSPFKQGQIYHFNDLGIPVYVFTK